MALKDFEQGESKYNSTQLTIERLNIEFARAAEISMLDTPDSYYSWRNILELLDREIYTYLNEKERSDLSNYRVNFVPNSKYKRIQRGINVTLRIKLDAWERRIRFYVALKGLAIVSKETQRSFILPGG
jgi:hypothetical protein